MSMSSKRERSSHDQELHETLDRIERNPFRSAVAADHTSRRRDPELVNGHRPDIVTEDIFGRRTIIEVEHRDDNSQHARDQRAAFEQADIYDPMTEFETEFVDDRDDSDSGFLPLF